MKIKGKKKITGRVKLVLFLAVFILILVIGAVRAYAGSGYKFNPANGENYFWLEIHDETTGQMATQKIYVSPNANYSDGAWSSASYSSSVAQQFAGGENVFDVQVYTENSIQDGWAGIFTDRYYVIPTHIKINSSNGNTDYIVRDFVISGDVAFENGTDADTKNKGTKDAAINLDTNNIGLTNMAEDGNYHHCTLQVYIHKVNFSLTADPNGGKLNGGNFGSDNGTTNSHTVTVKYGQTDYNSLGTATRTGYTFDGWYRASGTKVFDADGNCVTGTYWNSEKKFWGNCDFTVYAHWKAINYTMTMNHYKQVWNTETSKWEWKQFDTKTASAAYDSTFTPPYITAPTGYKASSRDSDSGWKVTGDKTFNLYYAPLSYDQTINYYKHQSSGGYSGPTYNDTLLGSKSWSQKYSSVFDAYGKRASWGNVAGYHWWKISKNSWIVTGAGSTNSYYYPNKYRLNVDLNKGSGSTTPSGTSGNFDMEYGTYINLGTPTMTGYTFSGWSIAEHNSTDHSLSANTFTMGYNKSYPNQSYTSDSTVKIKAKWNANSYNLIYDLNDSTGSTIAQFGAYHPNTVKFDTEFTVSNPSRAGYTFAGWNITGMDNSTHYYGAHTTTETYIDRTCETVFKNLHGSNKSIVTFKAVWISNTYTIHFDGNGAAGGNVDDITVSYDENMTLPANGYVLDRNTFVGWTHDCTAHVGTYAEGQEMLSSVIIDAAGMTTQNSAVITLYCAWDPAPNITVTNKTFTLEEAQNGLITEERLFEGVYAMDEILDSEILPGTHLLENGSCNSFTITNFCEDEFTQFTASGSATITYQIVDSVGNITEETITVFIVDNTPKEAQSGEGTYHVRFISDKYYDKTEVEGGLPEDSIWRKRPEYAEILNEIMGKY